MFWKKSKPTGSDGDLRGVPLPMLLAMLQPTSIKARIEGNVLIADHGNHITRVEVLPPDPSAKGPDPIRAVVRVLTSLPTELSSQGELASAGGAAMLNSFASLGAVTAPGKRLVVGSRLTIHQGDEQAWVPLYLPLLLFTIIGGSESVLGGLRRALGQGAPRPSASKWADGEIHHVQQQLSRFCACTAGRGGLTAEFPLSPGAVSAASGHRATALFQMSNKEPHPELGGGLFCVMHLPHSVADKDRLERICALLNSRELDALDLPPHFGAWCPGRMGNGPAYVSFLPNALHEVAGIATNFAVWAMHRTEWAHGVLASEGIKL